MIYLVKYIRKQHNCRADDIMVRIKPAMLNIICTVTYLLQYLYLKDKQVIIYYPNLLNVNKMFCYMKNILKISIIYNFQESSTKLINISSEENY